MLVCGGKVHAILQHRMMTVYSSMMIRYVQNELTHLLMVHYKDDWIASLVSLSSSIMNILWGFMMNLGSNAFLMLRCRFM
mmetsp:Transcript_16071/g.22560  ORF Transcript_16071/g.22560 Transcript_16071/m.22560 type:complete len:80 (-) Transcript_16071:1353-1592(-)